MIRAIGGLILIVFYIFTVLSKFYVENYAVYILGAMTLYVSLLLFLKGYVDLGVESVRGQFYVILSLTFLAEGLSFFFSKMEDIFVYSLFGIILATIARFFFFAANFRYIWFFQSSGYYLTFIRLIIVLVIFSAIFSLTFYIPNVVNVFSTMSPLVLFIVLDWGMVFIAIYNLMLLWGTDIGKRWAIGTVLVTLFLLGDATFVAQLAATVPFLMWATADLLMGSISLMKG